MTLKYSLWYLAPKDAYERKEFWGFRVDEMFHQYNIYAVFVGLMWIFSALMVLIDLGRGTSENDS